MAYSNSNDYEDGPAEGAEMPAGAAKETEEKDGETAVLPKSILAGKDFSPGDEVVLRIVRMHDDSVEVAYAPAKEQEKGGDKGGEGEMAPPEGSEPSMSSMMDS